MTALLIALDEAGILPKAKYRDTLHRLWSELPETDDFETEALSCQSLFEYLAEEKPELLRNQERFGRFVAGPQDPALG